MMVSKAEVKLVDIIHRLAHNPMDEEALALLIEQLEEPIKKRIRYHFSSRFDELEIDALAWRAITRAWRYAGNFNGSSEREAQGYVKRIWRNLAISESKRKEKFLLFGDDHVGKETDTKDLIEYLQGADPKVDVEKTSEINLGIEEIREKCSPTQLLVFDLLAEGYKQVHIAKKLNITRGAVAQTVKKIRKIKNDVFKPR